MHNHRDIEGGGGLSPASSLATLHLGQVGQLGQGDQLPGDRAASGDDERSCGWDSGQVEGCLFRVYVSGMSCLSFLLAPSGALIAIPTYYWPTSSSSTHFFISHQSSTLDFHFLSQDSHIKGNHWTQLLATCIPYGYNRTSLQDSAI